MSKPTILNSLEVTHFRSLAQQTIAFGPGIHLISGQNGEGKTNLLDAIYYLCSTRSHFNYGDASAIAHGQNWLRLVGQFTQGDQREKIVLKMQPRKGKSIERNDVANETLIQHVGLLPAVMISPGDIELVVGGPEERRRFLDQTIAHYDAEYLQSLVKYNRLLKARNAVLKSADHPLEVDLTLLSTYDRQLAPEAHLIFERRQNFVEHMQVPFAELYQAICGGVEQPTMRYISKLSERPYNELLLKNRDVDFALRRTNVGPHRDDLDLQLDGEGLRKFASQGQLKTCVLAMRLAQARLLKSRQQKTPILLLDDLFDRLDAQRVQQLLDLIIAEDYSQVFITDTHPQRLSRLDVGDNRCVHHTVAAGSVQALLSQEI